MVFVSVGKLYVEMLWVMWNDLCDRLLMKLLVIVLCGVKFIECIRLLKWF